jgi:hypothetical protein
MSQFCRPQLDTNLDSRRFVGKNTHELIALLSFGRVLLAERIGSRPLRFPGVFAPGRSWQPSESNGRLSADRSFLGRRVSVGASLACGVESDEFFRNRARPRVN